jgi:hypothetical protein
MNTHSQIELGSFHSLSLAIECERLHNTYCTVVVLSPIIAQHLFSLPPALLRPACDERLRNFAFDHGDMFLLNAVP